MLVDSVSFPTQPGAVTVLVRTRGRCFKQADTIHNVKQKWGGVLSHMHENQQGNALCKHSEGLRLHRNPSPSSSLKKTN